MKLSVSLSEADLETLDRYVAGEGLESRSAGVQQAIRLLAARELGQQYAAAWDEWENSGEAAAWGTTIGDGLSEARDRPVEAGSADAEG